MSDFFLRPDPEQNVCPGARYAATYAVPKNPHTAALLEQMKDVQVIDESEQSKGE